MADYLLQPEYSYDGPILMLDLLLLLLSDLEPVISGSRSMSLHGIGLCWLCLDLELKN